jgi:hypothetical protein
MVKPAIHLAAAIGLGILVTAGQIFLFFDDLT